MKHVINGIIEVIKLCIILYAVYIAVQLGVVDYIVNVFNKW